MGPIKFNLLPAPEILKNDVECFRMIEYVGKQGLSIKVSPNGLPGIVFQHKNGQSAIENIIIDSGSIWYQLYFSIDRVSSQAS